jgi:peptide/nickel transport system permease protein
VKRFTAQSGPFAAAVVLFTVAVLAVLAPWVTTQDPSFIPFGNANLRPSLEHWLGTDQLGRDEFARVVYGARTSLAIGFAAALLAGVLGVAVGAAAGFVGGWVDDVCMRFTDMFLVFPAVLLAGALTVVLGGDAPTVALALALVGWPVIARVTRSTVRQVSSEEWIEGARAIGCSEWRVLWRHVMPHVAGPIAVLVLSYVATAILGETALSFLGIGVQEPTASWGLMIAEGRRFLATTPHLVLVPSIALFVTVLCLFGVAEGLRSALGVRRGSVSGSPGSAGGSPGSAGEPGAVGDESVVRS